MFNMLEVKLWGEETEELVKNRKEAEQKRQRITFSKNTISVKKGEPINMSDFVK